MLLGMDGSLQPNWGGRKSKQCQCSLNMGNGFVIFAKAATVKGDLAWINEKPRETIFSHALVESDVFAIAALIACGK